MLRSIFFISFIGFLVWIAVWLSENPGRAEINWLGYEIETYFGFLIIVAGIVGIIVWTIIWLIRFVFKAPKAFILGRKNRRQVDGYKALTLGMAAIAAGDKDEASRLSKKANKLLSDPTVTRLLSAQTAALNGDQAAASRYFNTLRESKETQFVGLVGLMRQAKLSGEDTLLKELTEEAYKLRPESVFVVETLFDIQTKSGLWEEAQATLFEAVRRKVKPEQVAIGPRVTIFTARAYEMQRAADYKAAIRYADRALADDRDFVPAAIVRARLINDKSKDHKAVSLLESFCSRNPHPQVVSAYLKLWPQETFLQRFQRLQNLVDKKRSTQDTRLLVAEAALDAELWGEARKNLELASADQLTIKSCRLMSRLEQGERYDEEESRRWLEKTSLAAPDTSWTCGSCGAIAQSWQALCGHCGDFDIVVWKQPPHIATLSSEFANESAHEDFLLLEEAKTKPPNLG
ncbi:MAG: hypothetical protein CMM58_11675 [Rhodospirillaceae bacterium]|nr:hypothetical protein [Rhodospirillaceae bacterium]